MTAKTFMECCKAPVLLCEKQGWEIKNHFTVHRWHTQLRNKEVFVNP